MADHKSTMVIADSSFSGIDSHMLQLLLPGLLKEWFDSNIKKFKQIFSVIIIGLEAGNSDSSGCILQLGAMPQTALLITI